MHNTFAKKRTTMLNQSETFKQEYCCTIVRIGKVSPIENSDFLGQVLVEGRTIVVRKDLVHEGDVMFYVSNECQLNADFLKSGNYYEDRSLNADPERKAQALRRVYEYTYLMQHLANTSTGQDIARHCDKWKDYRR